MISFPNYVNSHDLNGGLDGQDFWTIYILYDGVVRIGWWSRVKSGRNIPSSMRHSLFLSFRQQCISPMKWLKKVKGAAVHILCGRLHSNDDLFASALRMHVNFIIILFSSTFINALPLEWQSFALIERVMMLKLQACLLTLPAGIDSLAESQLPDGLYIVHKKIKKRVGPNKDPNCEIFDPM